MLVPISWMEEYVVGGGGLPDVCERMTMSGSAVEGVKTFGDGTVTGVVLGRLTKVWEHPDSDHLLICNADVGDAGWVAASGKERPPRNDGGDIQIVTGAQNVNVGDFVPVAVDGAVLPGGVKIKSGKLRGEVSDGMLCSAQELGFDDKVVPLACKDGIWILPEEVRRDEDLGRDIFEVLGLVNEQVIDFEITPNRPDCLAIYGLAVEYAAVYNLGLASVGEGLGARGQGSGNVRVSIAKPEHCYRYIARVAENVVIKESPWWIQKRLMLAGMRPINNIVDITNYVMLELGHPIHAFDIREISGGEINVDTAKDGEKFTTLDGVERTLDGDMLLIKDGTRGVAIAGVMGGENSEIKDDTTSILIEAASFSADSVRRTSKKLEIRTEASSRYEKGVPPELSGVAIDRVCQLINETGAGTAPPGASDCYPAEQGGAAEGRPQAIDVRVARVNAVLGTALTADEMTAILSRLGIASETDGLALHVAPPYTRLDLAEEIDVVEEIARIYGYDRLASTIHSDSAEAGVSKSWALRGQLRELLTGLGLSEIQTYSFVSPSGVSQIGAEGDKDKSNFVKLLNPLGEENSVMRTTLLPELANAIARNNNYSAKECRLFEIGNTFRNEAGEEGLPAEALSLCGGGYGDGVSFYYMKGVILEIFKKLGLPEPVFEPASDIGTFHPGRCARIAGYGAVGEFHPDVAKAFGLNEKSYAFELDFDLLVEAADMHRTYKPLAKYPAVLRDIALLVDDEVSVGALLDIIRQRGGKILETAELFDVYRGQQVPEGKKSLAFGLVFRSADATLTDEDAGKAMTKILKGLADAGAVLRDV